MSKTALDHFGKLVAHDVYARCLEEWRKAFAGSMKDERSQAIFRDVESLGDPGRNLAKVLVQQATEKCLHYFLVALESDPELTIDVRDAEAVVDIKKASDGLPGELYGRRGWLARFGGHDAT